MDALKQLLKQAKAASKTVKRELKKLKNNPEFAAVLAEATNNPFFREMDAEVKKALKLKEKITYEALQEGLNAINTSLGNIAAEVARLRDNLSEITEKTLAEPEAPADEAATVSEVAPKAKPVVSKKTASSTRTRATKAGVANALNAGSSASGTKAKAVTRSSTKAAGKTVVKPATKKVSKKSSA